MKKGKRTKRWTGSTYAPAGWSEKKTLAGIRRRLAVSNRDRMNGDYLTDLDWHVWDIEYFLRKLDSKKKP